ncbi:MAG: hypothetical protein IJ038_01930 [Clostridia bacterium]|nr:hypothetical protein [Clostridia bacterium]
MANWNDIKSGVGRAANKTMKKAGELADTASLHFKLKTLNARLGDKFERLGRLTYKQLKTEISRAEEIAKVIEDIDSLREEIKALKLKIEELKKERQSSAEDVKIDDEAPSAEEEKQA